MNWQQQREKWNEEGKCAREACQGQLHRRGKPCGRHTTTNLRYCLPCTRKLQQFQGDDALELVEAPNG